LILEGLEDATITMGALDGIEMQTLLTVIFFISTGASLALNLRFFNKLNQCDDFNEYVEVRSKGDGYRYFESLLIFYSVSFIVVKNIVASSPSLFLKFLIFLYLLVQSWRLAWNLYHLSHQIPSDERALEHEDMRQELSSMNELINVKGMLLLQPLFLIMTESVAVTLTALQIFHI
jgi:hypothetical protein